MAARPSSLCLSTTLEVAMKAVLQSTLAVLAATTLLAACGGGDEGVFVEDRDPRPSGRTASATVSGGAGADAVLNGAYATSDVSLNNVTKVDPTDDVETCRFRFANLPQVGSQR